MTENPPIDVRALVNRHGLLAKWREDGPKRLFERARGFKLGGHMGEVLWAHDLFFCEPLHAERRYDSVADALYRKMRLDQHGCSFEEFARLSYLATLGHDLGKAGGEFQQMLWLKEVVYGRNGGGASGVTDQVAAAKMRAVMDQVEPYTQAYRHEFLSAVLMRQNPAVRAWFEACAGSPLGAARVLAGALGHHLKASLEKGLRGRVFADPTYRPKPVFLRALSGVMRAQVEHAPSYVGALPPFPELEDWEPGDAAMTREALEEAWKSLVLDPVFHLREDDPVSAAIKWMVILADTFGSLSTFAGETTRDARERIATVLRELVLAPRDEAQVRASYDARIAKKLGEGAVPKPFQKRCATEKNLLLTASTGGGKTVGALLWAQQKPQLRLLYTTSTTDTTSRLFYDYGNPDDDLLHSRRDLDVKLWEEQSFASTPEDDAEDAAADRAEDVETVDALRHLGDVATFTTADQVLGLLAFYRKSVVRLPYLLTSQVVFDEFHSYDSTMTAWYLRFLDWFPGVRSAHLSATVSDVLRAEVESRTQVEDVRWAGHAAPRVVADSRRWGSARRVPRYRVHVVEAAAAQAAFADRALWVVNTVGRCQAAGEQFSDAVVYHSRFKFTDRWGIRDAVTRKLPNGPGGEPVRVVATQVAEMSFDISARTLITEVCPPEAFVQRLGRVNRAERPDGVADVYVYVPDADNGLPYVNGLDWPYVRDLWTKWVRGLAGRDISKDDLDQAFQDFYRANPPSQGFASTDFLGTTRRNVRRGSYATTCLLRSDFDRIRAANLSRGDERVAVQRVAVPVLITPGEYQASEFFHRHAVVDRHYDPRLGVLDHRSRP